MDDRHVRAGGGADGSRTAGRRTADGAGDRSVEVRPPTPSDLDALERFYAELPAEVADRRFRSAGRPDRDRLRAWLDRPPAQGRRFVAVAGSGDIVADGGYTRVAATNGDPVHPGDPDNRDDGDAELDLTVAPRARSWLGPRLLDRLVQAARADGLRNLRVRVLVNDGPMLAAIGRRRHAAAGHDDHTVAHLLLGAGAETPQWPERHDRPRILIEGGGLGWVPRGTIRSLGVDALVCPGPRADVAEPCPVLEGRPCPLVEGADAVVFALGEEQQGDAILAAHRRRCPGLPLFRAGGTGGADHTGHGDRAGRGDGRAAGTGEALSEVVVSLPDDRPPLEAAARALAVRALTATET